MSENRFPVAPEDLSSKTEWSNTFFIARVATLSILAIVEANRLLILGPFCGLTEECVHRSGDKVIAMSICHFLTENRQPQTLDK